MMLDLIVAIVVALGFYLGYSRGLIKTVFDTLSLIIGIVAALKLSPITIDVINSIFKTSPAITFLVGVVLTFIGIMALIRFIGNKLEDILEAVNINFINKIAGGVLQGLFFAYLLSLGIWLIDEMKVLKEETKTASITYSIMQPLPEKGKTFFMQIKPLFKNFWDKSLEVMDKASQQEVEQ